jgi:hypothetical protein
MTGVDLKSLKKIYKQAMSAGMDWMANDGDSAQLTDLLRAMDLAWFNYRSAWGDDFATQLLAKPVPVV